jgi:hypothetical protein
MVSEQHQVKVMGLLNPVMAMVMGCQVLVMVKAKDWRVLVLVMGCQVLVMVMGWQAQAKGMGCQQQVLAMGKGCQQQALAMVMYCQAQVL